MTGKLALRPGRRGRPRAVRSAAEPPRRRAGIQHCPRRVRRTATLSRHRAATMAPAKSTRSARADVYAPITRRRALRCRRPHALVLQPSDSRPATAARREPPDAGYIAAMRNRGPRDRGVPLARDWPPGAAARPRPGTDTRRSGGRTARRLGQPCGSASISTWRACIIDPRAPAQRSYRARLGRWEIIQFRHAVLVAPQT